MKDRSLENILAELSEFMFPDEGGKHKVSLESTGYDGDMAIHVLARRGNIEDVLVIIKAGANLNSCGEMNETALHIAVEHKNIELIKCLIKAGANPNIKNGFGETAKQLAKKMGGQVNSLIS